MAFRVWKDDGGRRLSWTPLCFSDFGDAQICAYEIAAGGEAIAYVSDEDTGERLGCFWVGCSEIEDWIEGADPYQGKTWPKAPSDKKQNES